MGENQLYVANLPFQLNSFQVADVMEEKFERPLRVVCFKTGPPVPFRRQSAYVHWREGQKPNAAELEGWLPQCLQRMGWQKPLHATEVIHVSWLKDLGSDGGSHW